MPEIGRGREADRLAFLEGPLVFFGALVAHEHVHDAANQLHDRLLQPVLVSCLQALVHLPNHRVLRAAEPSLIDDRLQILRAEMPRTTCFARMSSRPLRVLPRSTRHSSNKHTIV